MRHLVFPGVLLSLMVISITFFIITSVESVFCINNSNIPTCHGAMLDAHKVDTVFLKSAANLLIYTTVMEALRCSLDPVPGGQDRAVVRHQPGPKPDLGGKGGPIIYQMNAGACSLASRGLVFYICKRGS